MQVLPFMPSLELYPRNSLLFLLLFTLLLQLSYRLFIKLDGSVKEERRRSRRVVLDGPVQRHTLSAGGRDICPLPSGEGGVSRAAKGQRPC